LRGQRGTSSSPRRSDRIASARIEAMLDRAYEATASSQNPIHPPGYERIGACCKCGYLGFIRLYTGAHYSRLSICSDCEGVPRPAQRGDVERIGPRRTVARGRKADAA
jgi:hypothetical protein